MAVWIGSSSPVWGRWWSAAFVTAPRMREPRAREKALEFARLRETPEFLVVDEDRTVIFHGSHDAHFDNGRLPEPLDSIVHRLTSELRRSGDASAIATLSPSQIVRVLRLEAESGASRYAVMIERFATRDFVGKAATRFGLSPRETEVLGGLMQGESTNDIARRLGIAAATVHEHIRKIGHKTNVTKRSAIVAAVFALR